MADADEIKKAGDGPPPGEAAAARDGDEFLNLWLEGIREPEDPILQGRGAAHDLRLFDEVRGDAQVWSTLQQRRDAVVAMPWNVKPGDDRPASVEAAQELTEQLTALPMDTIARRLLWGVFYGYGVGECLWGIKGNRVTFENIRVRRARRFGFDVDGQLMLRPTINRNPGLMPDKKFWVMSVGSDTDDEPYGLGLAHLLYWPVYFRRHGLRAWMVALDKFALPTAVGRFPSGTAQEDIDKALAALKAIRSNSSIMMPDKFPVDYLESSKSAGMDYHKFHEFLDGMIAKIVLSQTMTTDDGASRAQGEVHMDVRDEVAQADADLLCGSFNEGPATWWTRWNYGEDAAPPLLVREKDEPEDADKAASRDKNLKVVGWVPSEERVRSVYGEGYERAAPSQEPPEDTPPEEFSEEDGRKDTIADFVDQLIAEGAPQAAAADILAPLLDLVDGTNDLEVLRDRLGDFSFSDDALVPLADHLNRAAFAVRIGGEVGLPLRDGVEEEAL